MKLLKRITSVFLLLAVLTTTVGCYVISAQRMKNVKGTYKLTQYTYIPQYERKEGYTPRTFDYINDEEYKYEDYLIVTGESIGQVASQTMAAMVCTDAVCHCPVFRPCT